MAIEMQWRTTTEEERAERGIQSWRIMNGCVLQFREVHAMPLAEDIVRVTAWQDVEVADAGQLKTAQG